MLANMPCYNNVNYFPKCKKIIDHITDDLGGTDSTDGFYVTHKIEKNIFDQKYCGIAMSYIREIDYYSDSHYVTKESGFLYLLYWLYDKISKDQENNVHKVYVALLKAHKTDYKSSCCEEYEKYTISKEDINGIDKMYSMYECLNKVKNKDGSSETDSFCKAVAAFINNYNTEIHSGAAESQNSTLLNECQNNNRIPTIIIIIIGLLISVAFLILYKTPLGSRFRSLLEKKKNYWNTIDLETNNIQPPNITECDKNYNKYDILYHCD
ncbi:variable surface protein [Plasmodium gonderi]|uniref:Variable surface protein n=1 Tax=Plasmodium gonderi TaxID=77519 RepID=A0A1Y1JR14_PLAGO|nr:variable surface protein [Plasmodium gonderi]GAW83928.1 variable surface protein [Plasmodium gonderi]